MTNQPSSPTLYDYRIILDKMIQISTLLNQTSEQIRQYKQKRYDQ